MLCTMYYEKTVYRYIVRDRDPYHSYPCNTAMPDVNMQLVGICAMLLSYFLCKDFLNVKIKSMNIEHA